VGDIYVEQQTDQLWAPTSLYCHATCLSPGQLEDVGTFFDFHGFDSLEPEDQGAFIVWFERIKNASVADETTNFSIAQSLERGELPGDEEIVENETMEYSDSDSNSSFYSEYLNNSDQDAPLSQGSMLAQESTPVITDPEGKPEPHLQVEYY
jgi:hypothetical protein